ncbi:MAG TPA: hypothetical protein VGH87_17090 [Polyangiaceae bacterium]
MTRIYVLLARKADSALVFRRGPTKRVLLLRWDLTDDTIREGQWLHGHIYERRCDLSPSGEHLVYFAAKWRGKYPSFTAVSRPPYLTALALWEGMGAWGGGGAFADERTLMINHRLVGKPDEGGLAPKMSLGPFGASSGRGEDFPIWHERLLRDGWILKQWGGWSARSLDGVETDIAGERTKVWAKIDPPIIYRRVLDHAAIEMRVHGLHETNGPWYALEHDVFDARGNTILSLGRADWADFDRGGDLLFAKSGRIYRAKRHKNALDEPRELFDLRALHPVQRTSPPWAKQWGSKRPAK